MDIRQKIVASVFTKRNPPETYISHVKIWEETEDENRKPRYILLSRTNGEGFIHKSKMNTNGTFSIGKTWKLHELRGVEVVDDNNFIITLTRPYKWQAEDPEQQNEFVVAIIQAFRVICPNGPPLSIINNSRTNANATSFNNTSGPPPQVQPPRPPVSIDQLPSQQRVSTPSRVISLPDRNSPKPYAQLPIFSSPSSRPTSPPLPASLRPQFNGRPDSLNSTVSGVSSPSVYPPSIYLRNSPAGELHKVQKSPSRPSSRSSRPSTATAVASERSSASQTPTLDPTSSARASPSDIAIQRSRRSPSPAAAIQKSRRSPSPAATLAPAHSGVNGTLRTPSPPPPLQLPSVSPLQLRKTRSSIEKNATSDPPYESYPPFVSSSPQPTLTSTSTTLAQSLPSRSEILLKQPAQPPPVSAPTTTRTRTPTPQPPPPLPPPPARTDPTTAAPATTVAAARDPNARISFFDPANQAALDRLLALGSSTGFEEDSLEVIMANVEEMLEGSDWVNVGDVGDVSPLGGISTVNGGAVNGVDGASGGMKRKRTAADQIEASLQDELVALEKATIYAFLEDDDRVGLVLNYIDDTLRELDSMDTMISSYKIHLNAVSEDISYIQSQHRGLQVQTQNQKSLLQELQNLLETVNVNPETLLILTQESLEKQSGIETLERAASELYKALLSSRDSDMAMTMGRLEEYQTYNNQFCKRLHDYLSIIFNVQSDRTLTNSKGRSSSELRRHTELEEYLGRYCGLMLYLKEMSDDWYSKVCASYFSSASALHNQEIKACLASYTSLIKKATEEEQEMSFNPMASARGTEQLRRVRSIRTPRDRDKRTNDRELRSPEALELILKQIGPQVFYEEQFISDLLHINNDGTVTYAVYMNLESFFIRQASRTLSLSSNTMKLIRGAMDLIFGFLAGEIKAWVDIALVKDNIQVVGVLATLEAAGRDAEERGNMFWAKVLQKQHQRLKGVYDRHIDEQVHAIEQTKLTTKKRKGVAQFIKYFPTYVARIEAQLVGYESSETRQLVDSGFEKIVQSMFEALKQMAKLEGVDGGGGGGDAEDKGQLNYHVELVENMQYFITEMSQQELGNFKRFIQLAQSNYDENVNAYIKIILRRPFARILDFFDGIDRLLQQPTTPPSEIVNKPNYSKSVLKRVLKEYNAKDVRRHVDALFKRVEKHYTDEDLPAKSAILLKAVWMACEVEMVKCTERFAKVLALCYKDVLGGGAGLEYSVQDVEAAFRKHRLNGQS